MEASLSHEIREWRESRDGDKTIGALLDVFGERGFAVLFVVLLAVPALPLPTGGATHVFELLAMLAALQLIVGRDEIWLPERWCKRQIAAGGKSERFVAALTKLIRRLERLSKPRLAPVFDRRLSNVVFGVLVIGLSLAAFLAPPFTGLDTLPALAVVLLSLGVLLKDALVALCALLVGATGVLLEIVLGAAAIRGIWKLF